MKRLFVLVGCPLYILFWYATMQQWETQDIDIFVHDFNASDGALLKLRHVFILFKELALMLQIIHFLLLYTILQSFAIPGSTLMSVLSGALFPSVLAIVLISISTGVGATMCYKISSSVNHIPLPSSVQRWQIRMQQAIVERAFFKALSLMCLVRLNPFTPNWLINIMAPHLKVPLFPYFVGTCIGVIPLHYCYVRFGTQLLEPDLKMSDAVDTTTMVVLSVSSLGIFLQ